MFGDGMLLIAAAFAFALTGLGLLCSGLRARRRWWTRMERERARATGTVVDFAPGKGGGVVPVVRFVAEGQEYRLAAPGGASAGYEAGQSVDVLYDADDPTRFHLEARDEGTPPGAGLRRVGLVFLACGAIAAVAVTHAQPWAWNRLRHELHSTVTALQLRGSGTKADKEPPEQTGDYRYEQQGDNDVALKKYLGNDSNVLILPIAPDGRSVTEIDIQAFAFNDRLETVTIPGTVRSVSATAFYGCAKLRRVTLLSGVTAVGTLAFDHCAALEDVTLPASLWYISDSAFSKDCAARFHVQEGSYAERFCRDKGYETVVDE